MGGGCLGSWGERKKRASEEKEGGDCLGSWARVKKVGERGNKGGRLSVVGASEKSGRVRKKGGRLYR